MELVSVLAGISALFFILLVFKNLFGKKAKKKFCVICFSVIIVWSVLLILYWMGLFDKPVLIGILIGESILGIFYFAEKKVKKKFHLFKLPFLLTLISIAYFLINVKDISGATNSVLFLFFLWVFFFLFFFFKGNVRMNKFVNKIIECCRRI